MASTNAGFPEYQGFTPPPYEEPPRERGCFFYGCVIASVLSLLLVIAIVVIFFFLYRWFSGMIEEYTATEPRALPKVEMPLEARKAVGDRFDAFKKAVEDGKPTEPLVLSSDDLNVLIEDRTPMKGKVHATIENNKLKGEVSMPASDIINIGLTKGRYLNGEAEFKVSLDQGILMVTMESFEINGKHLPPEAIDSMRRQNLAGDLYKDPKNAEQIRKIESVEIKDGKLIIKAREPAKPKAEAKPGATPPLESSDGKKTASPPDQSDKKPGPAGEAKPSAAAPPASTATPSPAPTPTPPGQPKPAGTP